MHFDVGIGDLYVEKSPSIICTRGLGSCVGVTFYDEVNKYGALAHILLPNSHNEVNDKMKTKFRYANFALPYMLEKMQLMGSKKEHIVAKLVGGASMFKRKSNILNIGNKNIEAVKEFLKENSIRLKSEETGGSEGRSMFFNLSNGIVTIKINGMFKREFEL